MAVIALENLAATQRLGRFLAASVQQYPGMHVLLLRGPLGSGKTSLVRSLVEALPNGDQAEVASPSFTLCHYYPTLPPVAHHDLYRTPENLPDELFDGLENPGVLTIVEWAEYLLSLYTPQHYLDIFLQPCIEYRHCTIQAHGVPAGKVLQRLHDVWPVKPQKP